MTKNVFSARKTFTLESHSKSQSIGKRSFRKKNSVVCKGVPEKKISGAGAHLLTISSVLGSLITALISEAKSCLIKSSDCYT